ncbi:hypothetical protein A1Q1_01339 [Trichosporon asahii var. asahii CBS 2479]|uniref:LIM zinc-binding domain-containing protein n=1 Tax=Trichosporon asahii var. asahii (strain ATCC 90039 / CBS 2479 / JCM 2466 / KCTC 7840 / NBRC 103889/ NCYC 2677 / UAMH 7654) TaxID=1186058 RepID=J6EY28_TRIAS|nr:hypothetical protein A1Q1_01339 [Trichosporon asahii var. asahii CBS 2479]EJT49534.1 hypothetical protein A1Q1_01339 [Trichosporon asahii var. asahii CBS 2479]
MLGGTPKCARCNGAVYHAEQVMGPARKIYHKLCLKCEQCGKRLDPGNLVSHDEKLFGTRDLRNANHLPSTPPRAPRPVQEPEPVVSSPRRNLPPVKDYYVPPPELDIESPPPSSVLNASTSSARSTISIPLTAASASTLAASPGRTGSPLARSPGTPRAATFGTSPGTPTTGRFGSPAPDSPSSVRADFRSSKPIPAGVSASTKFTTDGVMRRADSPASKIGGRPDFEDRCQGCQKRVYAAEQVVALGSKWHRGCLRCTSCGTTVNPSRVSEHNGQPWCKNCYAREHGPEGLLGKR